MELRQNSKDVSTQMMQDKPIPNKIDSTAGRKLVGLARYTIESCAHSETIQTHEPRDVKDELSVTTGAFVTIERGERLRGCCGRVDPSDPLWSVVQKAAVDAALNDPRCPPIEPAEIDAVTVTVTVLSEPTSIDVESPSEYPDAIEIGRDGLMISKDRRQGLLLPQVAADRGWGPNEFLTAACQKAGLPGNAWRRDKVTIDRFTARAFEEHQPDGDIVVHQFDGTTEDTGGSNQDGTEIDCGRASDERLTDGGCPVNGSERSPAVAGQFYAKSEADLRDQIANCFRHEYGPGALGETNIGVDEPVLLVSPHAGYLFSGPVAANGFAALAENTGPETVVVFGPNHDGIGAQAAVSPHERWRTPLGTVPIDVELASKITEISDVATFDRRTHVREHSIEVQLPFLQYCLDEVMVVPICLTRPGQDLSEKLGTEVATAISEIDRDVAVLSSTDLTHHEPHQSAVTADEPVVDAIEARDTDAIADLVAGGHSMCGPWSTIAGLTAAIELGACDGTVLRYATSGQTGGSRQRVVGYCSVVQR